MIWIDELSGQISLIIFFYEIEITIIIIIIIIILIWHLNKLLVIRNDSRHRALFLLILLDYLYIYFFTQNLENMFEFALNARRRTRNFFFPAIMVM